jgi:hypothetical protein
MELRDQMEVKDIFLEVVEVELIHQVHQEGVDTVEEEQQVHHHQLILGVEAVEETLLECVLLQVLEDLV